MNGCPRRAPPLRALLLAPWELPQNALGATLLGLVLCLGAVRGRERQRGRLLIEVCGAAVSPGRSSACRRCCATCTPCSTAGSPAGEPVSADMPGGDQGIRPVLGRQGAGSSF